MKTPRFLLCLTTWLGITASALADGLIIIHDPPQVQIHRFPIRHHPFAPLEVVYHHVNVRVDDQVAVTSVEQEFYNPNNQRLEGTYVFPVPKGGQIDKFTMEINGKPVEAELMAADKARQIYEDIVRKMKDPALMEYAGRDIFKVRIFPIEPLAKKRITLSYSQVLTADAGLVSYLYPLNTEKFSAKPLKNVSVKVNLQSRQPLKTIYSPSHTVEIKRDGPNKAVVGYEANDVKPDTDFQLFFAPEPGAVGVNLMTTRPGDDDGYFLLLTAPGVEMKERKAVEKDIAFVLDTSGSMAGDKLKQAKKALEFCVENLNAGDRFEIIRFSTETEPLFDKLTEASEANRKRAVEFIAGFKPIGGTAIDEALRKALALRTDKSDRPFVVIFMTDGQPTIGATGEDEIVSGAQKTSGGNTRIFCFGIGTDVNTHLLDKITEATHAASQYVLPQEDIEVKVSSFYTKIKEPVLTNLKLTCNGGPRLGRMHPSSLPDLFKGEQLVVAGRYNGSGNAELILEGSVNGEPRKFTYQAAFAGAGTAHDFVPRLWATRRVGYLLDEIRLHGENRELKDEVTDLARKYGIVTPYTAYLIVEDEAQRNVPLVQRTMEDLKRDEPSKLQFSHAKQAFSEKAGSGAISAADSMAELKKAEGADVGMEQSVARAIPSAPASQPGVFAAPATARKTYAQTSRYVDGRAFYRNGDQWVDVSVQKMPQAARVRVRFASPEYFELLAQHPRHSAWFALGQNLQLALGDTIYEISE